MRTSPFSIRGTASFSSSIILLESSSEQMQPKKNEMCLKIRNKYEKYDFYVKGKLMMFDARSKWRFDI